MASRLPYTETIWVPGFAYVCVAVPETPVLLAPSPQWIVMPEPTKGMAMVWLVASVFQVVTNGSLSGACCASAAETQPATTSTTNASHSSILDTLSPELYFMY